MQDYYWVVWLLTVISWITVPFATHFLTNLRDRRSAFNSNLSDLSNIFDEMNDTAKCYFSPDEMPIEDYYKMLSHNERLKFTLKNIKQIDNKYTNPDNLIIQIRKITTDDVYRNDKKIHAMRELIAIQTRILDATPRKVRWF
ncbi:hypothetical protein SO574_23340 (plasmid) [Vibrio alfacsensis]|uniref:hypothetical protein n=1 Tax=Vibrio alfacsensis TaxID=1074311 RepID=UPI002ADDB042|nr:hypothetical protein [Vibrio alfacsensis]WQE79475.1 hypothetical protein SO574_23340 [Vibrio alfacsensis]